MKLADIALQMCTYQFRALIPWLMSLTFVQRRFPDKHIPRLCVSCLAKPHAIGGHLFPDAHMPRQIPALLG